MSFIKRRLRNLINTIRYDIFPKRSNIVVSKGFIIGKYYNINISIDASLNIGKSVIFREFCSMMIASNAKLIIGDGVFFNNYCSINCLQQISIGSNTIFGEGVKIYDHNHSYDKEPIDVSPDRFTLASITIGEKCWIGSNVTILKGVKIGNNVIIGADCLIYKSIPDNTIVRSDKTYSEFK